MRGSMRCDQVKGRTSSKMEAPRAPPRESSRGMEGGAGLCERHGAPDVKSICGYIFAHKIEANPKCFLNQ